MCVCVCVCVYAPAISGYALIRTVVLCKIKNIYI